MLLQVPDEELIIEKKGELQSNDYQGMHAS